MNKVGQREKATQDRVVKLFEKQLGYTYLGNWIDREGNSNIDEPLLREYLAKKQGYGDELVTRALHQLTKTAADTSKTPYDRNRSVYELLRYGVKVKPDVGEHTETVWVIDWKHPENNDFGVAEEVAIQPVDPTAYGKRPDVVLYVNGIALAVLELKRSTVSVTEGIRQQLDNQKKMFIEHFFSTAQWLLAGNDTEGLRYGTTIDQRIEQAEQARAREERRVRRKMNEAQDRADKLLDRAAKIRREAGIEIDHHDADQEDVAGDDGPGRGQMVEVCRPGGGDERM
jgi:type I restriction enzyme R subunit